MHSSRIINLSNEINGESSINVTTICHQSVYQSNYRARKKEQPYLNINYNINSLSINDTVEYYIQFHGCALYPLQCKTFSS